MSSDGICQQFQLALFFESSCPKGHQFALLCQASMSMNKFKTAVIDVLGRVLPDSVKNSLLHLSFHLARSEFDRFAHDFNFAPNMEYGLVAIAERFSPKTVIDVGAFEGDWSRMARRTWPDSRILMIEPNLAKQAHLAVVASDINASVFSELLGAEDNIVVPYNVMESGSSVLSERSPVDRIVERRSLRRLDSILKEIEAPAFLKIDTQGYELEVLKGSMSILRSMDAILLEVAIIEINEGAPLLHEVLVYMKSIGFVTYDILEIHRRPLDRALNQVDILFIREDSLLLADKRHFN
jgi:FkbM family methyltransferase